VLGHILNLDAVAQDLIDNRYAYLADVRHDMSRIGIPVSWIYGRYDKWISEREISDIMSVRADGAREVIEIPTGHNLRSSEDAIKTFKIITGLIYRRLHGKNIRLREPDRDAMVNLITYERERLTRTDRVDVREYWKDYLIGGDRSSVGYDFYKNVDEFREFLSLQGSLMEIKNGEIMADMGCGTGIFIERMLEDATNRGLDLSGARLVLLDLVEEALLKTREKYEQLRRLRGPLLPRQVYFIQMDLEPNRLLPVKRFIEDESLDYNFLRNRVEGLKNSTIDRLIQLNTESLSSVMRGGPVTDDARLYMNMHFSAGERGAVYDFNRAVRYLTGALTRGDLSAASHNGGKPVEDYKGMKTSDIYFSHLNFGAKGLELHLSLRDSCFDKISASLLVSYLFNPDEILLEFYRLIKPGGLLLVSSMRPDSDISVIFSNYISKLSRLDSEDKDIESMDINLAAARAMLNEAASLFELEEDGYFKFYSGDELADMLKRAGFKNIVVRPSLGNPPQAVIATGIKPSTSPRR